jgi:protein lysine acetyltransferase
MAPYLLNDGSAIEIRPIRHDDADRLQAAHSRLSPESRYRRFLGVKPILSASDVRYLVDVDGRDHFALVGTVSDGHDESVVAVARFVRLADDPAAAEFAIVVGDTYQRQGLATELLARLAAAASERGIERFRATILSDNVAIQTLIERLADGEIATVRRGSVTEVEFRLPAHDGRSVRRCTRVRPRGVRSSRRALEADRSLRT